jgi:primase-polymerase (primpol)-like protein
MLPISGLRGEETCYLLVVSEKRKHDTYQWSPRRGNLLPISGLGEEETCDIAVIAEKRKHVTTNR